MKWDWKWAKNLWGKCRQNANDITSMPGFVCFGQKAGPTDRYMVVYLLRGSSTLVHLPIYNDFTMNSCELYFMQCRNAETIVS